MDVSRARSAADSTDRAGRSVGGWLLGVPLLFFGALLCLFTFGDVQGELTQDRGTFTVEACESAKECTGTYRPAEGGSPEAGTLTTTEKAAAGDELEAEPNPAEFTENAYEAIPANRFWGTLAALGLSLSMLGLGVFALLTGYCPRMVHGFGGRWFRQFEDRRRVTFGEAWGRFPGRVVLAPVLGVVAGAGVLCFAAGLLMVAVS